MLIYEPNAVLGIRSWSHFFYQCMYQAGVAEPRAYLVPTFCPPCSQPVPTLCYPLSTLCPPCAHPVSTLCSLCSHPVTTLCPPCAHLGPSLFLPCSQPLPTLCPPMISKYRRPYQVLSIYQRSENSSMTLSEYNLIHVVHETIKLLKYLRKKIAHVSS